LRTSQLVAALAGAQFLQHHVHPSQMCRALPHSLAQHYHRRWRPWKPPTARRPKPTRRCTSVRWASTPAWTRHRSSSGGCSSRSQTSRRRGAPSWRPLAGEPWWSWCRQVAVVTVAIAACRGIAGGGLQLNKCLCQPCSCSFCHADRSLCTAVPADPMCCMCLCRPATVAGDQAGGVSLQPAAHRPRWPVPESGGQPVSFAC